METRFQTSFIPKKPMSVGGIGGAAGNSFTAPHKNNVTSIFMTFAVIVFILSLLSIGGVYAYKQYLQNSLATYKQQLTDREQQFNISLIEDLKAANIKIDLASQLLRNHLAMSGIFEILGHLTIANVRFLSLDLTAPSKQSDGVKVSMTGYGTNLSAVAFQSDVLSQLELYGLRKIVKNPILSDPQLDANGTVGFGFSATVDPSSLSYEKSVSSASDDEASSSPAQ